MSITKITREVLTAWGACADGKEGFCRLFPEGATLEEGIAGLVADNHEDWARWLFNACREHKVFEETVSRGYLNSGDRNSGDRNSGDRNSGYLNSGDRNSGDRNSGDWNSGDWNSGDLNSGYFNSATPEDILAFNKPCKRSDWNNARKPSFIYFSVTEWIEESRMTDEEKAADPQFYVRGGYLKTISYKEAWEKAWAGASEQDKALLKALPNFDAEVFKAISGIDVE